MSNFGAIVKAFADLIDRAAAAVEREVRSGGKQPKPKPCPVYVPVKSSSYRR